MTEAVGRIKEEKCGRELKCNGHLGAFNQHGSVLENELFHEAFCTGRLLQHTHHGHRLPAILPPLRQTRRHGAIVRGNEHYHV